jgi:maleylacetate reductase
MANPVAELAALRAAALLRSGLEAPAAGTAAAGREDLALGAILAGYAVGSAGFALHHVVGQTLVRVTGVPHARAYAVLLPHTLRAMTRRAPRALAELAAALGGERRAEAAPERAAALAARAGATRLSEIGVDPDLVGDVVEAILARPDLANTPDPPGAAELRGLIQAAL